MGQRHPAGANPSGGEHCGAASEVCARCTRAGTHTHRPPCRPSFAFLTLSTVNLATNLSIIRKLGSASTHHLPTT